MMTILSVLSLYSVDNDKVDDQMSVDDNGRGPHSNVDDYDGDICMSIDNADCI